MSQVISQSIKAPKIVRTGMPEIEEYILPPYPKWVMSITGKPVLCNNPDDEKAVTDTVDAKLAADAAASKATK